MQSNSRAETQTARRKAIYVELHPETAHGGDRPSRQVGDFENDSSSNRFTSDTASSTGKSERAVQHDADQVANTTTRSLVDDTAHTASPDKFVQGFSERARVADGIPSPIFTPLSALFLDPLVRRAFERAEREDGTAPAIVAGEPRKPLQGGAEAHREGIHAEA